MKKIVAIAAMLACVAVFTGCIDATSVVAVKKDGSGTITETVYLGAAMMGMMNAAAMGMGGADGAPPSPFANVNEMELKEKAEKLGEGVSYNSHKTVKKADGSEGLQVVYTFKDINNVKLSMNPDTPGGGMGAPGGGGNNDDPVTFSMTKGAKPKLVITMPKPEKEEQDEMPEEMGQPDMGENPQAMAMMKKMFDGFRFRMLVKLIDGEIAKSNASHVGLDPKTKKKQYITLMDMDLGKLMQDEAQFKKLSAMGQMKSMVEAKEALKDIKGLKIETAEKVTVDIK